MRKAIPLLLFILLASGVSLFAEEAATFDQAKRLAESQGKPILMEFLRPG